MKSTLHDEKASYTRISSAEIVAITRMFKMYDLKLDGRITAHYSRKLLTALGTAIKYHHGSIDFYNCHDQTPLEHLRKHDDLRYYFQ